MWQVAVGVSKLNKYAARDGGDTVEVVERPGGGLSVVLADAQGSGAGAKLLSSLATAKAVALLKDGVRDDVMHRAVHDYLYHYKGGGVSCTLTTLSADTRARRLSVTRNSETPAYLRLGGEWLALDDPCRPLGIGPGIEPASSTLPLSAHVWLVGVTDGVWGAGSRAGAALDVAAALDRLVRAEEDALRVTDALVLEAKACDQGRPSDDMSAAAVAVLPTEQAERRTMGVRLPLRPEMLASEE